MYKRNSRMGPPQDEFADQVIQIKRVTKVVKGGKRFKLSATVVVGDGNGRVGVGHGKANEVALAVAKGREHARKSLHKIANGRTIPHETQARFSAANVIIKPASPGTGLVATLPVRSVLRMAGFKDALTKSLGSHTPFNLAMATIHALKKLRRLDEVARLRNKPISYFMERGNAEEDA
ncbi:30S ribosomal protein S5 [candidate division WOR-3 bacterium]|uniref:Small ribosomal subunit protein uS5 n=1 Tax=candidate division WOR-3 bacterium TaxID=2052148 RepID=A0A9D5QD76_UNCW3|nr:30S ribosomal protein S5 [candidate division WOR-3 bacterium]MBD3363795.1 30S ribosomal protein S5 [candidate division WOR-3 bacterium]